MSAKLNQWAVVYRKSGPYQAPEQATQHLNGIVTGHPIKADGVRVTTSEIIGRIQDRVVTRSGSEYELDQPAPEYEAQFPNAKERLLASLRT